MRNLLMSVLALGLVACGEPTPNGEQDDEAPASVSEEMQREHLALIEPLAPDAFRRINFSLYHVFVEQRAAPGRPFCTAIESAETWRSVMQPAAIEGSQLFEPPEAIWGDHAVLLIARSVAADPGENLRVQGIHRTDTGLDVNYQLIEPAPSEAEFNWPIAVEVAKPLPATIRFIENGQVVCEARVESPSSSAL